MNAAKAYRSFPIQRVETSAPAVRPPPQFGHANDDPPSEVGLPDFWCHAGAKTPGHPLTQDEVCHHESSPSTDDWSC